MLVIVCPHCGPRNSDEFTFGGEVHARPDPSATDQTQWRSYLYVRDNVSGWVSERWFHASGCRRFLTIERHTVSNEIRSVAALGSSS